MRALKWVLLNGAFAAGVWVGFYEGHEGAQRVMVFLTCILFLVSMVAHSEASQKILATKGYPVPKTISITYDALITLASMDIAGLQDEVNALLADGWILVGAPFCYTAVSSTNIIQAMMRPSLPPRGRMITAAESDQILPCRRPSR